MDKPFTSKHCTPLNMGTPLQQAESISFDNPTQAMIDRVRNDGLIQTAEQMQQMKQYRDHQANMPQYTEGSSIGDKFNTTMKRIVHNLTGPKNPNVVGGTLPVGGAGLKGVVKGLVKLGSKAIEKYK